MMAPVKTDVLLFGCLTLPTSMLYSTRSAGDNEALHTITGADVAGGHDPHGAQIRIAGERHLQRPLSFF